MPSPRPWRSGSDAGLRLRWALWLMQANVVARFLPAIVLMIPPYVVVLLQRYVVEGLSAGAVKGWRTGAVLAGADLPSRSERSAQGRPFRPQRLPTVIKPCQIEAAVRSEDLTPMLKIYGVYRSRAARNIWLANELGIPFTLVPVMQLYRLNPADAERVLNTKSPEYLRINPNGHVPAIDDDGLVLHESLAINLYLARKHGGPLAPADAAEDGQMTMWALWAANELEPHAITVLVHRVSRPPPERDAQLAQAAIDALRAPFAVLDRALAATGYLVGDRFTVADLNTVEVVRYAMAAPELFEAAPNVKAWLAACHARPAFKAMMAEREKEPA